MADDDPSLVFSKAAIALFSETCELRKAIIEASVAYYRISQQRGGLYDGREKRSDE